MAKIGFDLAASAGSTDQTPSACVESTDQTGTCNKIELIAYTLFVHVYDFTE